MKFTLTFILAVSIALFSSCGSNANKEKPETEQASDSTDKKKVTPGTYCNEKYKFCITYPEEMMVPQGELEDGIGQEFVSPDEQAKLRVTTGNLDGTIKGNTNLKSAYEADIKPVRKREVTYKSFATTSYTVMGYEGKTIFYQKTIISNGELATAVLYYDTKAKDIYYPMIEPTFRSFK